MNKTTTPLSRSQKLPKIEHAITLFIYYGLPIIAGISLIYAILNPQNTAFNYQKRRAENGFNLLILILFIKPISILGRKYTQVRIISAPQALEILKDIVQSNKKNPRWFTIIKDVLGLCLDSIYSLSAYLMRFRRQLGITCFRFLFIHAGLLQIFRIRQDLPLFFNIGETRIIMGTLGLIGLLAGAITSNMRSMKILKGKWKKIQMVAAYTAFGFACVHTGNIPTLIVYGILKYYEAKETKSKTYLRIQEQKKKIITK